MEKTIVFMFSGQGSQFYQMGRELFDRHATFREWMTTLDKLAIDTAGRSIIDGIYNPRKNKGDRFDQILYTHPAIFMVEYALYRSLCEDGVMPDRMVGASMGEFVAAAASGMVDYRDAFRMVLLQARLYTEKLNKGGMIAILDDPDIWNSTPVLRENSEISAFNFDSHFVISVEKENLQPINAYLNTSDISYLVLPVEYPFHSSYIDGIRGDMISLYSQSAFGPPAVDTFSCATTRKITRPVPEHAWDVIRKPIRFSQSVSELVAEENLVFLDVGPSGTLSTFMKYILPNDDGQSETLPIITPFGHEMKNYENIVKRFSRRGTGKDTGAEKSVGILKTAVPPINGKTEEKKENTVETMPTVTADKLGDQAFRDNFNLRYAYLAGGMSDGISSGELVIRMGKAGLMGFLGTRGMPVPWIEENIRSVQKALVNREGYGMNLIPGPMENDTVDLYLKYGIQNVEAYMYMQMTPALVKYRVKGLFENPDGGIGCRNRIIAKVSRPEIAENFLSPPPERILRQMIDAHVISEPEARLARDVPMADALCVEGDSGGPADRGMLGNLLPAMFALREKMKAKYRYRHRVYIGAAGGIGTPGAAAAAFVSGADFILTGSINQCTAEAGTSDAVKDMLQEINVQDTAYAPAGDMFEMGGRTQVMSRSVFFPARANKLFTLYQHHGALDEIDAKTKDRIEAYFGRTLEQVYEECERLYSAEDIAGAEKNPKRKMALVFRWYLDRAGRMAREGREDERLNYQVYCGPSLGAFNQWIKGTELEDWRNRHADQIGLKLMEETAAFLKRRFQRFV